jgi:hypothetical protein
MPSSASQKVTTDPESTQKPIRESPGVVISDSLAAESYNQGGGFSAAPGPQPARSTTTNTTDTTNAEEIKPGEHLSDYQDQVYTGPPSGGKDAGVGPTYNIQSSGGTSKPAGDNTKSSGQDTAPGGQGSQGKQSSQGTRTSNKDPVAAAPHDAGKAKPKGKNLTEGGIDGNEPNASFNNEIGTENDPARAAIQKLQRGNADSPLNAGTEKDTRPVAETGEYDALEETEA